MPGHVDVRSHDLSQCHCGRSTPTYSKGPFGMAPGTAPGSVFQLQLPNGYRRSAPRAELLEIVLSQCRFGRWSQKMQLPPDPCQARVDLAVGAPAFFLLAHGHRAVARGGPTGQRRRARCEGMERRRAAEQAGWRGGMERWCAADWWARAGAGGAWRTAHGSGGPVGQSRAAARGKREGR
jgi:hypothetical protein